MSAMPLRRSGFTIIELLIVIVVIGILATITIVAFTGINNRAQMSSVSSAVSSVEKLLKLYKTENGSYPNPGNGGANMACIGQVADYPARDGFEEGECDNEEGVTNLAVSTQLNDALKTFSTSIPSGSFPPQYWANEYPEYGKVRGITYRYYGPTYVTLYYSLPGIQQCVRGATSHDTYNNLSVTDCTIILT